MNERERFIKTMRFEEADRAPYFEQFIRDDVIDRWRKEGLPRRASVAKHFNLDRRKTLPIKLARYEMPRFEHKVENENDLNHLRKYLEKALKNAYPHGWKKLVEELKGCDYPVGVGAWESGILQFIGISDWSSFERACLLLYDKPDLAEEMIELNTQFLMRGVERALDEVKIDFAYFTEPIAGADGPIISPAMFRKLVIPRYKRVMAPLKEHGIEVVIMRSFGNIEALLPDMVKAGITGLWMTDMVPSNMDYASIREKYGQRLALIGGIDSRVLTKDEEAIEKEITSKVPPLLASGGYIPTIDNRPRSHIPFKNFAYYRKLLEKVCDNPTD
jgi:uroporphyrinogen decarboxylase